MNTGTIGSPYKRVRAQFYKAAIFELNATKFQTELLKRKQHL